MFAKYRLSSGKEVKIFLWSDLLEKNPYRETVEVTPLYDGKDGRTSKKKVLIDENGAHFIWNGEKVYIHNFMFEETQSLVNRINVAIGTDDKWSIRDDDIWATMQKDTNNIGVVIDLPAYDFVMPQLGIGFTGDKEYKVLCVLTEKQYTKDRWSYKITLECDCVELRKLIPSRNFYFSDFCSLIRDGHAEIVMLNEYKKTVEKKKEEQKREDARFCNKVARFFGFKKKHEELPLTTI